MFAVLEVLLRLHPLAEIAAYDVLLGESSVGSVGLLTGIDHNRRATSVVQIGDLVGLKTDRHWFYRKGYRIVRVGIRNDGVTPYQVSFSRNQLCVFVKALEASGADRAFAMNGGSVETLGSDLSMSNAYLIKTWLEACGLIVELYHNWYRIASESIADDVESWWERTPASET